jgi:hypothetical protein
MAIHLTPTELARESGMHRREVIDKTLFADSLKEAQETERPLAKAG